MWFTSDYRDVNICMQMPRLQKGVRVWSRTQMRKLNDGRAIAQAVSLRLPGAGSSPGQVIWDLW
jgi:hypothetical protein